MLPPTDCVVLRMLLSVLLRVLLIVPVSEPPSVFLVMDKEILLVLLVAIPSPPIVNFPETPEGFTIESCEDESVRSEMGGLDVEAEDRELPGRGRRSLLLVPVLRVLDRVRVRVREMELVVDIVLLGLDDPVTRPSVAVVLESRSEVVGSGGISGIPMTFVVMDERLVLSGPGGVPSLLVATLSVRVEIEVPWKEGVDGCIGGNGLPLEVKMRPMPSSLTPEVEL